MSFFRLLSGTQAVNESQVRKNTHLPGRLLTIIIPLLLVYIWYLHLFSQYAFCLKCGNWRNTWEPTRL